MSMESVFSAFFAFLLLGDQLSALGYLGAMLMMSGTVVINIWPERARRGRSSTGPPRWLCLRRNRLLWTGPTIRGRACRHMILCKLIPLAVLCAEPTYPEDLAAYSGKSPFAEVEGARILEIPRVAVSIKLYAGEAAFEFIEGLDQGTTVELRDDVLITGLCDKDNCEGANAAIALARDGGLVAACTYSRDEKHGAKPGEVHWAGPFLNKTIPYTPDQACPQDAETFVDRYAAMRQ